MGNLISRNSTTTKAQLAELGSKLEASDAAIVEKERDLVAKSSELEHKNAEHAKLSVEAEALRKRIDVIEKARQAGQQEIEKLEAELKLENVDKTAKERTLEAMRLQQEKLRKDLNELDEKHESSSETACKLAEERDAVEKDLKEAVEQRTLLVQQLNEQVAGLSDELTAVRTQLDGEKNNATKLKNEMVSVKYSNFETLEATKKLLAEAQEKYKTLEAEHLRLQKETDERISQAEKDTENAREAYKVLKKESETKLTAAEFDVAEVEMKNVALEKELSMLRGRADDEAAVAKIHLVDSEEKHDSKTEVNAVTAESSESEGS